MSASIWNPGALGPDIYANLIKYLYPATGTVIRTVAEKLDDSLSINDLGVIGDGTTDDGTKVEAALNIGVPLYFPDNATYNLGARDIIIAKSVVCIFGVNVKFKNGRIRFRPTDTKKSVSFYGNVTFEDASVRVQGTANVAHTDYLFPDSGAVTFRCDNIDVINIYAGGGATTSVDLWNLKNSQVGVISVSGTAGGVAGSQAVLCQDIYDSQIVGFNVNGGWVMGVQFDSSSTRAAYSLCRTQVGFVNVEKNIADESGDHGCYLHGAYKSSIGNVFGEGWGATISSCATFKFRDNLGCYVRSVSVDTMRITADNNYSFFTQINRANFFEDIFCSSLFATVATSPGYSVDNVIKNLRTDNYSADSNQATQSGYIFTGICNFGVDTPGDDINAYGIVFSGATVTLTNSPDFSGQYFTARNTTFNGNLSLVPGSASTVTLEFCKVNGTLTHAGTAGTHNLIWNHSHITGTISTASAGGINVSASWRYVSSDAIEIADPNFQPDTKSYRYVAFSNVVYDLV